MNDKAEIKAIIERFYEIISGTSSQSRDWSAFRRLFAADAQFRVLQSTLDAGVTVSAMDVETYIDRLATALAGADFYEQTTIHEIYTSRNIATVVTSYAAQRTPNSGQHIKQGTCFLHLVKDEAGWRICSMIYQDD